MRERGLALLVVIGILGVLAVLGTAFLTMSRLERKASQQRLHTTRALLLARSGLEDATARLSAGQDPASLESRFTGEDYNDDGLLSPGLETEAQMLQPAVCNREDCPTRLALRPSFFVKDPAGSPALLAVDARPRGYSGYLSTDHAYSLKVEDESAKINVNGGFLDGADRDADGIPDFRDPFVADTRPLPAGFPAGALQIGRGWNGQLVRVLNLLGTQLGIPTLGDVALQNRPVGGYRTVEDLGRACLSPRDLSPFLTVSSWVDAKVVHPNAYPGEAIQASGFPLFSRNALSEVKEMRLPLRLEEGGRPPVNLNAATRPVLIALLQGLQGNNWHRLFSVPQPQEISPALAPPIADALLAFRAGQGPFGSWEQFAAFCDGLVPTVITGTGGAASAGWDLAGASLLKAAFDPNTHLNKQLPDELMHYWIDKSDLTQWSTEGSLYPTGVFKITAVGRVLGADGRLLAERSASQLTEAFSLLRQTSQKDFVGGRQDFQDYLSLSSDDTLNRTTGASNPSWKTWAKPVGLAVTTYPCPPMALHDSADFDGAIALATTETLPDPPAGSATPVRFFLHHFDDGWDADVGADSTACLRQPGPGTPASDQLLQTDPTASVWPDGTLAAPANEPSTLYPDGVHPQNLRSPAYSTLNFPPADFRTFVSGDPPVPCNRGALGYWVKPCASNLVTPHLTCLRLGIGSMGPESQVLMTGEMTKVTGIVVENRPEGDGADPVFEREERQTPRDGYPHLPGLRWKLMTCLFDTGKDYAQGEDDLHCDLRAFPQDTDPETPGSYQHRLNLPSGEDLFDGSAPSFVIGCLSSPIQYNALQWASRANQVMDELAICDFGAQADALTKCAAWASARFQAGRYYKGNDGAFLSTVLELETRGSPRLLAVHWTQYLPKDAPKEALGAGLYAPRTVDPSLTESRLDVDLMDENATLTAPPLRTLMQGAPVALSSGLPRLRYRVRFLPTPDWTPLEHLDQPVLETPWFDDITFAWQRGTGPRVLAWERP